MGSLRNIAAAGSEASLEYLDAEFRVKRPGSFVRCAVTFEVIPIEMLRYWNVDRQEAYVSAAAVLKSISNYRKSTN